MRLNDIQNGKEKIYTAQILHNWCTLPLGNSYLSPLNFIYTHDRFEPAKTILRDNVHLVGIEENVARFVEIDEHADILNLRKHPFLSVSQILHTKQIVLVPLQEVLEKLTTLPK